MLTYKCKSKHLLKHTAIILISPDEYFWNRPESLHQQTSVALGDSLVLTQQSMEVSGVNEKVKVKVSKLFWSKNINYIVDGTNS